MPMASSLTRRRASAKPTLLLTHSFTSSTKPTPKSALLLTSFIPHRSTISTISTPKVIPIQPHLSFPGFVSLQCKSGFTKLQDARNLFDQMLRHKPTLDIIVYTQLLGAVAKMGHFSTVISLYTRMMGSVNVKPNLYTFNTLINCLGKLNQMRLGLSVLGVIFRHGYTPDRVTFSSFIRGYCIKGKIDKAMVLFTSCERFGARFDVVGHGVIIDGLCKNGKLDMAVEMVREMETNKGISPDIVIYNSLIHGMCHERLWKEANGYFKEMLDRGISPDLTTYTILIDVLCKDDKLDKAREVMAVMISRGIEPNLVTFSSLVHGYCLSGRIEDAINVFNTMVSKDCGPNLFTYNALIEGFCKIKNPKEGARLFSLMQIHGESKDVLTQNSLLDELHENWLGVPMKLLREVENKKLRPDIVTYNILIAGMVKHGQLNNARELFNSISTKGLKPNLVTYNTMIDGFCKQGMMDEAKELFLQMEVKGCLSESTFNSLIHGYSSCGKMEDAVELFNLMVSKDFEPDLVTYNTLIDGFCKMKIPNEASRLFNRMQIPGKSQDVPAKTMLPDELCENQLGVALQLFCEAENKNTGPDIITYNILMSGMLRYGHLENARELFYSIPAKGLKPDVLTYIIMINGFCKEGMMNEAKELIVQMKEKGCTPDEVALLGGYLQKNDVLKALDLMQEMIGRDLFPNESTGPMSFLDVLQSN